VLTEDDVILLVPDAHRRGRARLLRDLNDAHATVGPPRPWMDVAGSYARALRARDAVAADPHAAVDTESHLAALVLAADPEGLEDLRRRVLAPLADLRPLSRERLILTLRSWLLHQGRRDDVAADLVVHPQTVRYRLTQIRELYGDALNQPQTVLELVTALGTLSPEEARAFAEG
jgi:DNA-binding PucR family transcriptional regulator